MSSISIAPSIPSFADVGTNPTPMRVCNKCTIRKQITDFVCNKQAKELGRRNTCKTCINRYAKERKASKRPHQRITAFRYFLNGKKGNKCQDCQYDDYRALDNDHVHGTKSFELRKCGGNLAKLYQEWKKTELVCSCCHAKRTWDRLRTRSFGLSRTHRWLSGKRLPFKLAAGECVECHLKCTGDNHYQFDWDHIDPTQKTDHVSQIKSLGHLEREIVKCRLLCKNCHRKHTWSTRGWFLPNVLSAKTLTEFNDIVSKADLPEPPSTKTCNKCNENKPFTSFPAWRMGRQCLSCHNALKRIRMQTKRANKSHPSI